MNRPLSHSETSRALRAFIFSSALWGSWGQVIGIGTAVFTGYAMWLGATDAQIAYFVSVASFASLGQVAASWLAPRIGRKKRFIFLVGLFEMGFRFCLVFAPLFFSASGAVLFVGVLLGLALACGHIVSPIYNGWLASVIPEDIRARFISRQTMANLLAGMVAAYLAGKFVDTVPEANRYMGFAMAFAVASILGIGGYVNLMRVPFREPPIGVPGNLMTPFHDKPFRNLLVFFLLWNFVLGLSGPFYSIFLLRVLQIDYATVALFNGLFMASMVVGYRVVGSLVDRYGGKVILQILVPPCVCLPVMWVFNRPDMYVLIPVAMAFTGLVHSGIIVAVNALLFGMLSEGRNKTTYFAAWSTAINLTYAMAPLLGSAFVGSVAGVRLTWLNMPVGNLQLSFLVTGAALLIPLSLLRFVEDQKRTSPGELLAVVGRGNLVGYLYSALSFRWSWDDEGRGRAMRQMGRSRSPMALDQLIRALDDASPEVRRQAARGLGETQSLQAVSVLLDELKDEESDIRSEAVEALGKIGDHQVIDPLVEALDDGDLRVRISAIRALSEIGGEEARELLFWKFADRFDRATFPTLADVLGSAGDFRMVRPTLERLAQFRSPAIRLQLLNSVCRALGAGRRYYRLVSMDQLTRAEEMEDLLKRARRSWQRTRFVGGDTRKQILLRLGELHQAFDGGDADRFFKECGEMAAYLETHITRDAVAAMGPRSSARIGAAVLAMRTFLDLETLTESPEIRMVFPAVCLWCIGNALEKARE